ncbi:hypothetical protein Taro_019804 [Colocasia esculenta]|uniref:Myb-like domain-containing protein n=1 Tax=Colocasia esculenta TaxID=4460 RepID=A0A843ULZ1_COLES|nr:hypothetical protein [Colocasia esculenta]
MDDLNVCLIMEFILRQPIDDWLAKEILLRLPTPALLHPHLKKTLFLRCLTSDLSCAPIRLSHHTLDSLELLEEVDRSLGAPHTHPALSAAYCAVAAELTVAPLRKAGSSSAEAEFLDTADRIWNCRVPDLERSEGRGLVSEGLREWRRRAEDALACEAARGRLLLRDTRGEAEAALREYLRVAVDAMGPPILELMATAVCGGAVAGRCERADLKGGSRDDAEPGICTRVGTVDPGGVAAATGTRVILRVQEEGILEGSEQAQRDSRKDRIAKPHLLPIPEVSNDSVYLPEAVENIIAEVPVGTEDLPKGMAEAPAGPDDSGGPASMDVAGSSVGKDAQATTSEGTVVKGQEEGEQAGFVQNRMAEAPTDPIDPGHNQEQAHKDMAGPSVEKDAQTTCTKGYAVEDQGGEQPAKVPRTSLMERNPTAHTCQWDDDSVETLSEKSADSPKRPHLPTPKVHRVSPLKLHGVGNWKCILQNCPGAFEDRTEVDLKDKWRNMSSISSSSSSSDPFPIILGRLM